MYQYLMEEMLLNRLYKKTLAIVKKYKVLIVEYTRQYECRYDQQICLHLFGQFDEIVIL